MFKHILIFTFLNYTLIQAIILPAPPESITELTPLASEKEVQTSRPDGAEKISAILQNIEEINAFLLKKGTDKLMALKFVVEGYKQKFRAALVALKEEFEAKMEEIKKQDEKMYEERKNYWENYYVQKFVPYVDALRKITEDISNLEITLQAGFAFQAEISIGKKPEVV